MSNSQFTPQEQRLIDQLRQSPTPAMRPDAAENLHQRLMSEADQVWSDYPPFEVPPPAERRGFPAWLLVAAILLLTGVLVMVFLASQPEDGPIQEERISTATQLPITPSPTSTLTLTPTALPTSTPTRQPTALPTTAAPPTSAPEIPPPAAEISEDDDDQGNTSDDGSDEAAQPAIVVVEGPVAQLGANFLVLFDILVETGEVQPLPQQLAVGSIVRVEGESRIENGRIIVRALQLTLILPPTSVPPVLPPPTAAQQPPQSGGQPPAPPPPPPPNASTSGQGSNGS